MTVIFWGVPLKLFMGANSRPEAGILIRRPPIREPQSVTLATHRPTDHPVALPLRHVAAVVAGNALEFYDFLTYSFFAVQIGWTYPVSVDR
jgi:hypothetical protein